MTTIERQRLTRDQIAALLAQHVEPGWIVNLGIGIPTLVSNFLLPEQEVTLTSENGVIGYGGLAAEGQEDPDLVNAGVQFTTLQPGGAIVHHADSFALVRQGLLDVTMLGAYQVACDGSFANWKTTDDGAANLGGIGGAMDLAACAQQVWLAMEHTTRDGQPRLLQRCTLPVTAPRGVTRVCTDIALVAVQDGRFILEQWAPGYDVSDVQALTGAPLEVAADAHMMAL